MCCSLAAEKAYVSEDGAGGTTPVAEADGASNVAATRLVQRHQQLEDVLARWVAHVAVVGHVLSVLSLPRIAPVIPGAFPHVVVVHWGVAFHVQQRGVALGPTVHQQPRQIVAQHLQLLRVRCGHDRKFCSM